MIIRKVRMVNFRGFVDKTIEFDDGSVVILSAANGMGKTTTIDAIEWCLTGEIGRLKRDFDVRSTNTAERKMNTDGILKNRDARPKESVSVFLWLYDGEEETIICRTQTKDVLDESQSTITIDGDEERAKAFIEEYVNESFYNFHFCDIHKSFNIQSQKRKDLKDLFEEFITNYDDEKQIAENLETFAEDVDRHMDEKQNQKLADALIEEYENQLSQARENAKQFVYPEVEFYPEEKIEIETLDNEALKAQKEDIENCGYQEAEGALLKLVKNEGLKKQLAVLEEIAGYWNTKAESVRLAVKKGLNAPNPESIKRLETSFGKLKGLTLDKDSILEDAKEVILIGSENFTQEMFDRVSGDISEREKQIKDLQDDIDLLSKNNKMLSLVNTMLANKEVIIEHRDAALKEHGTVKCPVCGSETFSTLEKDMILKEADEYITQNNQMLKEKGEKQTATEAEVTKLYQKLIESAKLVVEAEKENLQAQLRNLKELKDEMQSYFDKVKEIQKERKAVKLEELDADKVAELVREVKKGILDVAEEKSTSETYQQTLTVLGYKYEGETIAQTEIKVKNRIKKTYEITNFSYENFVKKINALDSILANQDIADYEKKLKDAKEKNKTLDQEIGALEALKTRALERASEIRRLVEELSKDEYKKVGPVLCKYYNKLARVNFGDEIQIIQENDGISLVDGKKKNIVNILSNGQISVFMLAYFFAAINMRNKEEKMKVYFIDDLTACMDDVNMLAFLDLLKYHVSAKETMDQLFFVTCDDRIRELLIYKLKGRGIEPCVRLESHFA